MKRLHVHVVVDDLTRSIEFYSALFGSSPNVTKPDYAKWQVEDPRVNFAVSKRAREGGLDHLGIQVEDATELQEIAGRLAGLGTELVEQHDARCCYARSDKAWARDPQGIAWETFLSHGEVDGLTACGEDGDCNAEATDEVQTCCATTSCGSGQAEGDQESACCA